MLINSFNNTLLIFFLFSLAMFEGFGQLDCIHFRTGYGTVYNLYLREDNGGFTRIAFKEVEDVGMRTLAHLGEGRLYARANDLRDTCRDRTLWNDTIGIFRLEDIDLVILDELPLERVIRLLDLWFPDNRGERVVLTGYKLSYNIYSADGRLVARGGVKMSVAQGEHLIGQSKKR